MNKRVVAFLAVLAISLACVGGFAYVAMRINTIPTAPLPNGARLLSRNAAPVGYWSAQWRYWYYEKYSVAKPFEEVEAFYDGAGTGAHPYGHFYVEILPPIAGPDEEPANKNLAPALRRDSTDPPGETIILIEVSWEPLF